MKKMVALLLVLILCCSCAKKDTEEPEIMPSSQPEATEYDFEAQYIELHLNGEMQDGLTVVRSRAELENYGDGIINKDYDMLEYSNGQASFNTLTEKYTDEFFKSSQLIICTVTEPSCSNRHKVLSLTDEKVEIERIISEAGDDAMASWAIIVESEIFDTSELNIYLDGQNKTGTPADVTAYGGVTSLSIHIPKGWEYEVKNIDGEYKEYGIYFHPKGEAGRLYLNYQTALGLCGTGLETERITVAGYECDKLTWDGKPLWDMIDFNVDFGAVNVQNESAHWLESRYDEVMEILESIKITPPKISQQRAKEIALETYNSEYSDCRAEYDILRDTYTVRFYKDGIYTNFTEYTVYSNGVAKPEKLIDN